ncbi:WD repeat-containing protein 74-like [Amphiura filiformis]|uniref:WD repeat-containing protein 74-like n=1 Tax=Amphiura filiformis TaxID=82378 RepID=UPI003B20D55A
MAAVDGTHVWIGAETGILKGVNLAKKSGVNYADLTELSKDQEITVINWAEKGEDKILTGLRNGLVRTFDANAGVYLKDKDCSGGEGIFRGLAANDNAIITCVESGLLKVWKDEPEECTEIEVGANISKMRQNFNEPHQVATGGKENDLKVWDLNDPTEPIFKAKNVRNDFLDLRVPVWVTDMQFLPESDKIVTCTGHHKVRLYDPSTPRRRPVLDVEFDEYPIMSLSALSDGNSVIVGNSHGYMGRIDLRKGLVRRVYRGFAGSIRSLQCHPTLPVVASCGLDRFLRIHDTVTGKLQTKVYLKSRLNCLLFSSADFREQGNSTEEHFEKGKHKSSDDQKPGDEEAEELWRSMEVIDESAAPSKHKSPSSKTDKKPSKRRKTGKK